MLSASFTEPLKSQRKPRFSGQLVVDPPVVLDPGRREEPLVVRNGVDIDLAAGWRAEQERGEGVAFEHARAVQRAAREVRG